MSTNSPLSVTPTRQNNESGKFQSNEKQHQQERLTLSSVLNVLWSSIALASDGYNSQSISSAGSMLKILYPSELGRNSYKGEMSSRVSSAYYVGLCLGSLCFGFLIDRYSRKAGMMLATCLMIIGVALCTGSWGKNPHMMFWMLTVSRGILGFGAGGEYPVCSTGATEAGDETPAVRRRRGLIVGIVGCTSIDMGIVFGGLFPLCILAGFGYTSTTSKNETMHLGAAWRTTLGLGCVIPATVFYFRWRIVNSKAFSNHSITKRMDIKLLWIAIKTYWTRMLGCCLTWFLYDFCTYPYNLLTPDIVKGLPGNHKNLIVSIGYSCVLNAFLVPGCIFGSFALDYFGRRNTMALGFLTQSILAYVLAGALIPIETTFPLFIVLYGVMMSLGEFGPGVTTLLVSSECFPTAFRGHFVGLAAAVAKAGAAIGTVVFNNILNAYATDENDTTPKGLRVVVFVGASVSVIGLILTLLFIPNDKNRDLNMEDVRFRQILADHGFGDAFDKPDYDSMTSDSSCKDFISEEAILPTLSYNERNRTSTVFSK